MPNHTRNITTVLIIAIAAISVGSTRDHAGAAPIDDKRAEAAALQDEIDVNGEKIGALGEQFNGAQLRLDEADQRITDAQAGIDAAKAEVARIKTLIRHRAETEQGAIDSAKSALEAANAKQAAILTQVNGELEQLVQEEAHRRAAEEARRARARYGSTALGNGNPEAFPNLPAPGAAAATAIEFARAQLGKPYVYAAVGPDSYDCSGLTMTAYAAAGIRMPHYSGAQYSSLPHVPLDTMLPGDLVFWGSVGLTRSGVRRSEG